MAVACALLPLVVAEGVQAQGARPLPPVTKVVTEGARVPVSGGIRVGLQTAGDGRLPQGVPTAIVAVPPATTGDGSASWLCLEVSAQDARYAIRFGYQLPQGAKGEIALELSQPEIDRLRPYPLSQLALLASLSSDCKSAEPVAFLVARWRPATPSDAVVLLLNSRVPTTIRREPALQGDAQLRCVPAEGEAVSFNLRCEVPVDWLKGDSTFSIQQRRGRSVSTITLPVRNP
jgi:hypothetical protein